jgi:hypothetical protein
MSAPISADHYPPMSDDARTAIEAIIRRAMARLDVEADSPELERAA